MANKVLIETSARHIHVSDEHLEILFGKGASLTPKKELSQPGQYACEQRLDVVGPKKTIPGVSILGPTRGKTQVEVSLSDARTLGLNVPVRESGAVAGSAGCKLVGPAGEIELAEGVIVAKRHVHLDPQTAEQFDVQEKEIVSVKCVSDGRSLTFGDVVVRISPSFKPAMHIDTDEANAAGIAGEFYGDIIK